MNCISPSPHPYVLEFASAEDVRRAIDLVATLRARAIRVGLFGTLLYRPDPAGPTPPEKLEYQQETLAEQIDVISRVCATLRTGSPLPGTDPEVSTWIYRIAQRQPDPLRIILEIEQSSKDVLNAARTASGVQAECLDRHGRLVRGGLFDAVTALCDAIWADMTAHQNKELERANASSAALLKRLTRLEHIGKHVRLVSLNASVEAARAGDVGKGLMVIAHEFKALAEEIQALAKDARQDMDALS